MRNDDRPVAVLVQGVEPPFRRPVRSGDCAHYLRLALDVGGHLGQQGGRRVHLVELGQPLAGQAVAVL